MLLRPDGCAGFIDETGDVIISRKWDSAWIFREGLAAFSQENKWGFIDPAGQIVIPPRWDAARHFHEGVACVSLGARWGVIDSSGEVISQPQWTSIPGDSSEYMLRVSRNGKYGFINRMGETVVEPECYSAESFSEGLAFVSGKRGRGFIDQTGEMVIQVPGGFNVGGFFGGRRFSEGFVCIRGGDRYGFMNRTGHIEIPVRWDSANNFSCGLAVIARNRKGAGHLDAEYGFIKRSGEVVVSPEWYFAASFAENYGYVQKDGGPCFINERGEVIIELERGDFADCFVAGMAGVQRRLKWGLIGRDGRTKVPMVWDSIDVERVGKTRFAYRLLLRKISQRSALAVWLDPDLKEIWQHELPLVGENLAMGPTLSWR
jgi:hypothetical protein